MRIRIATLAAACVLTASGQSVDVAGFNKNVQPIIKNNCTGCHNEALSSGNVNLAPFLNASTVSTQRGGWEKIIQKIRSGEMPPKGIPRPAVAAVDAMVKQIQAEYEKIDRNTPADPGRVTARRLNRNEYSNTIRDLLAVEFRANKDFPTDDSGYGFDNIADILTISPILMEKYVTAAEAIAAKAIGADPLPKPVEVEYAQKDKRTRRIDPSTIEASHRVDFDAEYQITIGLPGERGPDAKPVKMGFWMDGQLLKMMDVETKPSKLEYFSPYSEEHFKLFLPEGDHVFRVGFVDDDFVKGLTGKNLFDAKKNKYQNMMKFVGPYPSTIEKASRKKILVCDPKSGSACVERIISALARRAYRRPATKSDVASLMKFVAQGSADGQSIEQGIQLAITAMLVSPHFLFRIEHDPNATDAAKVHQLSELELASRLSYFLWSSIPDDELQTLAETGKLRTNLDAQVRRMMNDKRAAALASNFAGQWLEIRNLEVVKPDPVKFPGWTPELRDAMMTETRMFFEYVVRENRPMSDFIDARYTFLNGLLAKHYGIEGIEGPDFRMVGLATDQRGGVLAHASVLTVSSYPTRTSPTIRGKYVLNNILGTPPPPPPPDVPPLDDSKVGESASLRQQLEEHRKNAVCASCHNRMDVLGFGLENYDGIGKWRTKDGKFPIDVAGTMPNGKKFETAAQMRAILMAEVPQISHSITEKMMTYALGRGMESYDNRTLDAIDKKLAVNGYKFQDLIFEIAHSLPFQSRRGEAISQTVPNKAVQKPKEIAAK